MAEQPTRELAEHLSKLLHVARLTLKVAHGMASRAPNGQLIRKLVEAPAFRELERDVEQTYGWLAGQGRGDPRNPPPPAAPREGGAHGA